MELEEKKKIDKSSNQLNLMMIIFIVYVYCQTNMESQHGKIKEICGDCSGLNTILYYAFEIPVFQTGAIKQIYKEDKKHVIFIKLSIIYIYSGMIEEDCTR